MNYWLAFITGLTAGGISCMAVQGGLLAGVLANQKDKDRTGIQSTAMFLVSKLAAYTILGGLLGLFGSLFQLSTQLQILFQLIAAVLMIGLAANLLNLHPVFRYFVIQPPKWVGRMLRRKAQSEHVFAPVILGLFTVLIPCGVTQAMEISAIASGSWYAGAMIMFFFTLGTSPIFFLIGYLTRRFSASFQRSFSRVAGVLVILVALSSLNGVLVLTGSRYSLDKWAWAFEQTFFPAPASEVKQNVTIKVSGGGYTPDRFTVRSGERVTLNLETHNNYSCTSVFTIPQLGITRRLPATGNTEVSFVPTRPGLLTFSCGMGMYAGSINVI